LKPARGEKKGMREKEEMKSPQSKRFAKKGRREEEGGGPKGSSERIRREKKERLRFTKKKREGGKQENPTNSYGISHNHFSEGGGKGGRGGPERLERLNTNLQKEKDE